MDNITRKDYFVGQALTGLLANPQLNECDTYQEIAEAALESAEAVMKAIDDADKLAVEIIMSQIRNKEKENFENNS